MVADQLLTSVRFDTKTLDRLKLVADVNDTSVAAEVRTAVARYLDEIMSDAEAFRKQVARTNKERNRRVDELLAAAQ